MKMYLVTTSFQASSDTPVVTFVAFYGFFSDVRCFCCVVCDAIIDVIWYINVVIGNVSCVVLCLQLRRFHTFLLRRL